jgi:glycosyltransferase involved in cell wall biosynthesis
MSLNARAIETEDVHFRVIVPLPTPVPNLHRPALDIVVPIHNQEQEVARAVRRLRSFLRQAFPFSARITIADCASTDTTRDVATALAAELVGVRLIHLNEVGRGRALAAAWMTSDARIVASADAGLDIDVSGLPQVIAPVISGHSEISVGARFKAVRADVARRLIPTVLNRTWFFDTEFLLRARRAGMRIHPA